MCVICVKQKGIKMPSKSLIHDMWITNPHGCGYMINRNDKVLIRKGFMTEQELFESLEKDKVNQNDALVLHFRISTQAGIRKTMTHPFPFTSDLTKMEMLNAYTNIGIAHNGIIRITSNPFEKRYNDTAIFIAKYMTKIIHYYDDLKDETVINMLEKLTDSKLAILDKFGNISLVGDFYEDDGLLFSNLHHKKDLYKLIGMNSIYSSGKDLEDLWVE